MILSYTCTIILLIMSLFWSAESTIGYSIKRITDPLGIGLETPNWSEEQNVLYFVDFFGQKLFRMDGETNQITTRKVSRGVTGLIIPLKNAPDYVIIGIQTSLYILNFASPDADKVMQRLTSVHNGRPDNALHDAKVDDNGNMWFGSVGEKVGSTILPNQAALFKMTNETYICPTVALTQVTVSDGIEWSLDYRKMYYIDQLTLKIMVYDYDMEKGEIANGKTFFDFKTRGIRGRPNGMTRDSDGNLYVATFDGGRVVKINSVTGMVMLQIIVPDVDQVNSLTWGGESLEDLYIVTGKVDVTTPKDNSGCVFKATVKGSTGVPPRYLEFKNYKTY